MSNTERENIQANIKEFIIEEFLEGEGAEELSDDLDLVKVGVLDSTNALEMVVFVEKEYNLEFQAAEMYGLSTINKITNAIVEKIGSQK